MANTKHLENILEMEEAEWNTWRETSRRIRPNLSGADLAESHLVGYNLSNANLSGVDLTDAVLMRTHLQNANLTNADLSRARAEVAFMSGANLQGANLSRAHLRGSFFLTASLQNAKLHGADLIGANFFRADLRGADFTGANLNSANLVEANIEGAIFNNCRVYGMGAWNLIGEPASQVDLIITPVTEPNVTVDNLKVAQFFFLILNNAEIRDVIDTIGKKGVLILGRFSHDRKVALDAIRNKLRSYGFLPFLFDFEKPSSRTLTETVSTLAQLARFIIADITDAKSIPQELQKIVPNNPSVPVQPIILASQQEYAMFTDFLDFPWVLDPYAYESLPSLLSGIDHHVIGPAMAKSDDILRRRNSRIQGRPKG